jgi:hypothetical protein
VAVKPDQRVPVSVGCEDDVGNPERTKRVPGVNEVLFGCVDQSLADGDGGKLAGEVEGGELIGDGLDRVGEESCSGAGIVAGVGAVFGSFKTAKQTGECNAADKRRGAG